MTTLGFNDSFDKFIKEIKKYDGSKIKCTYKGEILVSTVIDDTLIDFKGKLLLLNEKASGKHKCCIHESNFVTHITSKSHVLKESLECVFYIYTKDKSTIFLKVYKNTKEKDTK